MNVFYKYVKFYAWETNIKRDMLVQKMKIKHSIFQFLTPVLLLLCEFSFFFFFFLFRATSNIQLDLPEDVFMISKLSIAYNTTNNLCTFA